MNDKVYVVFRLYDCDCCTDTFKGVYTSEEEVLKKYPNINNVGSGYFYEEVLVNEEWE